MPVRPVWRIAFVVVLLLAWLPHAAGARAAAGWTPAAAMSTPRTGHTATLLKDGRVLVVGGGDYHYRGFSATRATAEIYDPASDTWSQGGMLGTPRVGHTATLLTDGRVLVIGGSQHPEQPLATAELYDPRTNAWTSAGAMRTLHLGHQAVLLPSGQVLVMGGVALGPDRSAVALDTTERYDPATNTWAAAAPMTRPRAGLTATPLRDGRIFVTGGSLGDLGPPTSEVYDPATDRWTPAASMHIPRSGYSATLLADGRVLVAGSGYSVGFAGADSPELYDPATDTWTYTARAGRRQAGHRAVLLASGQVLVTGYFDAHGGYVFTADSAERYDPVTDRWTATAPMGARRGGHTATLLPNGAVLVVGGIASSGGRGPEPGGPRGNLATAELYRDDAPALPGLPNTGGGGAHRCGASSGGPD